MNRKRRVEVVRVFAALIAIGAGCSDGEERDAEKDAVVVVGPGTGTGTGRGTGRGMAGTISVGEASREDYCNGSGPPTSVLLQGSRNGQTATCSRGLAAEVFQYGLCSCSDAVFTGAFEIDAFDSARGPYQAGLAGASVGVNDQLISTGVMDISGSLIVAGSGLQPIVASHYVVDGNVMTNGDLHATGTGITFGRDLWVNGEISAIGLSNVIGDVYQTPGHGPPVGMQIGGQVLTQDFEIADPCACGEGQVLDIEAIVRAGHAASHNADVGLGDQSLVSIGVGAPLDFECGRFALEGAHIVGATTIRAHGRTALFIDGDLTITGNFGVDLGTTGELDVFVTGNLLLTGAGVVGSVARPAALRFYVGGGGDIAITGANRFAANLYAPRSTVTVTGADAIYGAFFVGSFFATGAQVMHYDSAITRVGDASDRCDDDDCAKDLDCGSPRVCSEAGRCTPLGGPD